MLEHIVVLSVGDTKGKKEDRSDETLNRVGTVQRNDCATELGQLQRRNGAFSAIYAAPHSEVLEMLTPLTTSGEKVRCEPGFRFHEDIEKVECLTLDSRYHKKPIPATDLAKVFNFVDMNYDAFWDKDYKPGHRWMPDVSRHLLFRVHQTLSRLIQNIDKFGPGEESPHQRVLIVVHPHIAIAISRILTDKTLPEYRHWAPNRDGYSVRLYADLLPISRFLAESGFHASPGSISAFRRLDPQKWPWKIVKDGDQHHLSRTSRSVLFRYSTYQNRPPTGHPVCSVINFLRGLPGTLLWGPGWVYETTNSTIRAVTEKLRRNPYRIPAWIFIVMLALTLASIVFESVDWHHEPRCNFWLDEECRHCQLTTLFKIRLDLWTFFLMMFPALIAP